MEPWAWAGDVPTCCSWGWWQEVAAWLAHSKALAHQIDKEPEARSSSCMKWILGEKKWVWAFPLKSGPKLCFFWTTCRTVGGGMSKKSQCWPWQYTFYCSPHQQRQKDWASSKGDLGEVPACHPGQARAITQRCSSSLTQKSVCVTLWSLFFSSGTKHCCHQMQVSWHEQATREHSAGCQ